MVKLDGLIQMREWPYLNIVDNVLKREVKLIFCRFIMSVV